MPYENMSQRWLIFLLCSIKLWSHPAKGACLTCFGSCNVKDFGRPEITNFDDIFFLKEKNIGGLEVAVCQPVLVNVV